MDDHNDWCEAGKRAQEETPTNIFGKMLEDIRHVGRIIDGKMVCDENCPAITHRSSTSPETPDEKKLRELKEAYEKEVAEAKKEYQEDVESAMKEETPTVEEWGEKEFRENLERIFKYSEMGYCPGCGLTQEGLDHLFSSHDAELRQKIEKFIDENDDGMWAGRETADAVLALLDNKNV